MPRAPQTIRSVIQCCTACLLLLTTIRSAAQVPDEDVVQRIVFIGDGGTEGKGSLYQAAAAHAGNKPNTVFVLLGDNIYPAGMPDDDDRGYKNAAQILQRQLVPFKGLTARVCVLPGESDWQRGGPRGMQQVQREASFVDSIYGGNIGFYPKDGCPGPEEIDLGHGVVLVIMDSQWWLHPYEKTGESSDCDCKKEEEIVARLQDIAYRNRNKHLVLAMHHPLRSHGVHGSYFTLKQHIFPLTDINPSVYVPLPLIGSLYPLVRGGFGNRQDLRHPGYENLRSSVEQATAEANAVTFVGGHDHNLQFFEGANNRNYIVSGSGSHTDRVKRSGSSRFATAEKGFAEFVLKKNGSCSIVFYTADEQGKLTQVYTHDLPGIKALAEDAVAPSKDDPSAAQVTVAVAPEYDKVGGLHRSLFGTNYRKVWATPVTMKVFYLEQEQGGLSILQKGGGMQTKSLRLKDKKGKEWVLRSLQKDPSKALDPMLRKTFFRRVLQDEISTALPYAPLTLPPMAAAAQVPCAPPQLVYVPDDPALGPYRKDFAHMVCLFEEREPGIGAEEKSYSTDKVLKKLAEDQDNLVNEPAVVRARLFDMVIGDWDRHEDQWRWGKYERGDSNLFYPIPRDRDQVYYINSGLFPKIVARKWLIPKFQGFKTYYPDINGFNFNARYFDRFFLHALEEKQWTAAVADIQRALSDSVIEIAVQEFPEPVYALEGKEVIEKLKARRNALPVEALKYYRFLARKVEVPGSDKRDFFEIKHLENGRLETKITKIKKDGSLEEQPFYHRVFEPGVTNELRLYGRGGEDVFLVSGAERSCIRTRLIGGKDADSFAIDPALRNRRRIFIYDRSDEKNSYPARRLYLSRKSRNEAVNEYNGRTFRYNKLMPAGTIRFNPDDGLLLGAGVHYTSHGFRKEPYATDQELIVGHALATNASFVRYKGDFRQILGRNSLRVNLDAFAPDNTRNFFGIGNETVFDRDVQRIRYYRTRYNILNGQVKLYRPLGAQLDGFAGLTAQYYDMNRDDNTGRLPTDYEAVLPDQEIFSSKFFAGGIAGLELDTRNNDFNTTRGLHWTTTVTGARQSGGDRSYGQLFSTATLYTSLRQDPGLVLVNRVGGGTTFGHPLFYQLLYLGGNQNLRGYRNFRFAGNQYFYHNIEARIKLFDFASYLFPASVGITAFNDVGRVWARGEDSRKWHDGYGGGVYIIPADKVYFNVTISRSTEGVLPYFSFDFNL